MSDIAITSSTQTSFTIPKLRDDGSNWTDYEPRVKNALGAKGLWKHADGRARQPVPLIAVNNVLMARGSTTKREAYHSFVNFSSPLLEDQKQNNR